MQTACRDSRSPGSPLCVPVASLSRKHLFLATLLAGHNYYDMIFFAQQWTEREEKKLLQQRRRKLSQDETSWINSVRANYSPDASNILPCIPNLVSQDPHTGWGVSDMGAER